MLLFRWLLSPFSFVYYLVSSFRNLCFNKQWIKSHKIPIPSISIGNLSLGGTGKSPLTNYLIHLLKSEFSIYVLSRGYGRKTKGFKTVETNLNSAEVGDEPLAYKIEHGSDITVAVDEDRVHGISQFSPFPENGFVLLDDAFQHRRIKTGFSILLSTYDHPFHKDFLFPMGMLRERRSGVKRADLILITKCPPRLKEEGMKNFKVPLEKYNLPVFFSWIKYLPLQTLGQNIDSAKKALVVTGIAQGIDLKNHISNTYETIHLSFSDHHLFTRKDIDLIHKKFDTFAAEDGVIVTTSKDYMRLKTLLTKEELLKYPWSIQNIELHIENEIEFIKIIKDYAKAI
jgi:tetraacyldisaccharide 4'-kinase